jgi:methyl-accepting chemotaxis protein
MADDRTSEFLSLARSLPEASSSTAYRQPHSAPSSLSPGVSTQPKNNLAYAQLKDFHTTAGGISRDIAAASQLLAELTQLVKQKSLFVDDSQKVNSLVVRIKSSVENLNGRLDEAGLQIVQQKRQLGKNSQASQEASNLVGQLKEEFGQAAAGFKAVLQQRTDTMKETSDRKRQVYGSSEEISLVSLENKPIVYQQSMATTMNSSMGQSGFATLDLTSGMSAGEDTSSGSQLPRPRKSDVLVFQCCLFTWVSC